MSDVKCPYCGHTQEIDHDDGYGYEEGETHEQECRECEEYFKFTTQVMHSYTVMCQDGDHDLEVSGSESNNHRYQHQSCTKCNYHECKRLD